MRSQLLTLYTGLSKHKQVQLFLLVGFMVIGMGFELLSIALIIPFLTLISDVSTLNDYQFISGVLGFIQVKSGIDIVLIMTHAYGTVIDKRIAAANINTKTILLQELFDLKR